MRYAVRVLLKNPGFSTVAVLALALGIGLNVTVFSIIDVLLLKPLPFRDAAELAWVVGRATGPERVASNLTHADIQDLKRAGSGIRDIAAFAETRMAIRRGTESLRVRGEIVTGNYFDVLGVPAAVGRSLTVEDDAPAREEAAAVIGDGLSRRLFVQPSGAVGQIIEINGQAFTIIGVAPAGFRGADILAPADVWAPLATAPRISDISNPYSRTSWWLKGIARLAPGTDASVAQAALAGVAAAIAQEHPDSHKGFGVALHPVRGATPEAQRELAVLGLLPAVPLAVLLIACANVASLLIARGIGRQAELAIKTALGASRRRLVRQLLAESLVLALAGGTCSLLLSLWTPELLLRLVGAPVSANFTPDMRVLLFTIGVSVVTALAFGLAPALRATRPCAASPLRSEPGSLASGPRASRLQRMLVAGQLAVSLVLLMTAGVFVRSIAAAGRAPVGFETANRVTLSLDLTMQRYNEPRAAAFHRGVLDRVSALQGIQHATLASYVPLGGRVLFMPYYLPGAAFDPQAEPATSAVNFVAPGFFETLQMPIRRGRSIRESDYEPTPRVAVVNEAMAARLAPRGDVLGQRLSLGRPSSPPVEIIGVAADAILDEFGESPRPGVYLPHDRRPGEVSIIAWTSAAPATALRAIEAEVHAIDPSLAVFDAMTMSDHLANRMDGERGLSKALAVAGALALGLAALGLYGVTAYSVMRRTREIGVRIALGASRRVILTLILGDAARLAAIGTIAGLLPALGVTYLLSGMIFGVRPVDPMLTGGAILLLASAAVLASYVPTRRALRIDPIVALRSE